MWSRLFSNYYNSRLLSLLIKLSYMTWERDQNATVLGILLRLILTLFQCYALIGV